MGFWVFAGGLALGVVAALCGALLRRRGGETAGEELPGIALYREQLAAVARDAEAGRVSEAEAGRLELEIKRRILEADRAHRAEAPEPARTPRAARIGAAAGVALAVVGGAGALYFMLGQPGYRDQPVAGRLAAAAEFRANRPGQEEAAERMAQSMPAGPDPQVSDEFRTLMAQLREAVAKRPDDLRGRELLMRNELAMGNYTAAAEAQQEVIRIKGAEAGSRDHLLLAELWISAAGGYVSPEAEGALEAVLDREPGNMVARYYWGLMHAQTGRPDIAFRVWRSVLANLPENAPWADDLPRQMAAAAAETGVDWTPPESAPSQPAPAPRGPSAADIEAAGEMSEEDRQAMIRGMVEGLAAELADQGGPPARWAQLIRALGVLGETERQAEILAEAREVFAGNAEALATIEAAAGGGQ